MNNQFKKALSTTAKEALQLFSVLLEKARRQKGFSQKELAERAGVSRFNIQNVLKGDPSVSIGTYFEVACILDVPLFTENTKNLRYLKTQAEEVLSLLPSKVHFSKEILDDNF